MIKKLGKPEPIIPKPIANAASRLINYMKKEKLVRMTFTSFSGLEMNITLKDPKDELNV